MLEINETYIGKKGKMKVIMTAKTSDGSVKIAPLSKNSWNLDKYFSGIILSNNIAKSLIILNFIKEC